MNGNSAENRQEVDVIHVDGLALSTYIYAIWRAKACAKQGRQKGDVGRCSFFSQLTNRRLTHSLLREHPNGLVMPKNSARPKSKVDPSASLAAEISIGSATKDASTS